MTYTAFVQPVEKKDREASCVNGIYIAKDPSQPFFAAIVNEHLKVLQSRPYGSRLIDKIKRVGPADSRGYKILIDRVEISYDIALNARPRPRGGRSFASAAQKSLGVASDASQRRGEGVSAIVGWCPNQVMYTPRVGTDRKPHFVPMAVTLGHELIHALHHLRGTSKSGSQIDVGGKMTSEEEAYTVGLGPYANKKYTENKLRRDFNLPERLSYP